MKSYRYSTIDLTFPNKNIALKKVLADIAQLPLHIESRHITKSKDILNLKLIVKTKTDIDIVDIEQDIEKL